MNSRILRIQWLALLAVVFALTACSSGGSTTTAIPGEAFNLLITASADTGLSPLTVTLSAVPSGGVAPYSYSWDFNGDGVADSNASSGTFVYVNSAQARVVVTDGSSRTVVGNKSIIITGTGVPQPGATLDVRFTASPMLGNVPFTSQFNAIVSGGKLPYSYAWDFDGDGTFDSFLKDPLYTFTNVGNRVGDNLFVSIPVLQVTDARGTVVTNLDDSDSNGFPDFELKINALPQGGGLVVTANANPSSGQAPLSVEFTGAVSGAAGTDVEYRWDFGDGQTSAFAPTSIATHVYPSPGSFIATVTARDNSSGQVVTSSPVTVNAAPGQTFSLTISTDITSGQVPFFSNFEAKPVNGTEPINYTWDVFNDVPNGEGGPGVADPPSLDGTAVVTPDNTTRKSPRLHFGNTASAPANTTFNYTVRCVAVDGAGNTAVSNLVRVGAQPRVNPGAGTPGYYEAVRPLVVATTVFPAASDPSASANPVFANFVTPFQLSPRANSAVCSHPSGVTFIMGGEILDPQGRFQGLVTSGDSNYAYVPRPAATGRGEAQIGKYTQGGNMVRLSDGFAPPFTRSDSDSPVPPVLDPQTPPAQPPPSATLRSAPFNIVGSAASVFVHETPETNDEDKYPPRATGFDPAGVDGPMVYGGFQFPDGVPASHYTYPDSPMTGWNVDGPPGSPSAGSGLGVPVVYVFGGRTGETQPATVFDNRGMERGMVQRYYPFGFGTEDVIPWSNDFQFQTSNNQADIWSPYFIRPDSDQYPGSGQNFDPDIRQRSGDDQNSGTMPLLPRPLYGLMAAKIESGVDIPAPVFPNGPFSYVFVFGGIDNTGAVRNEAFWWDTTQGLQQGENTGENDGLWSELGDMPTTRAYGKAVVIPGNPFRVALIGGIDGQGNLLNTVDIFTFNSLFNPNGGNWSTYQGTLPEALMATGAGYNPGVAGQDWVLAFAGWTGLDFNYDVVNARLGSPGSQVTREGLSITPRYSLSSGQSGASAIQTDFNRYYLIGGLDENGTENILEVVSLP